MPRDVALVLDPGQTVVADSNTDYIECEGGYFALVTLLGGVFTGASTTLDARVMFSVDVGANYYMAGKFQQLGPTDDSCEMRIPVYIPRPTVKTNPVRVRMNYDAGGVAPSYAITRVQLEPMLSLAPPSLDEDLSIGLRTLKAAV